MWCESERQIGRSSFKDMHSLNMTIMLKKIPGMIKLQTIENNEIHIIIIKFSSTFIKHNLYFKICMLHLKKAKRQHGRYANIIKVEPRFHLGPPIWIVLCSFKFHGSTILHLNAFLYCSRWKLESIHIYKILNLGLHPNGPRGHLK